MNITPSHIIRTIGSAARRAGSGAFVDQGIISGLNFLTFLVLARWLEVETFGSYVLAFSGLMFFQSFQHALITRAHNVLGAQRKGDEYHSFTRSVFAMAFMGAVVIGTVLSIAALLFHLGGWANWSLATISLALAAIPWLVQDTVRRLLYTTERIGAAAVNDAVSYVLQFAAVLGCYWFAVDGTLLVVFGILGGSSLMAVFVGMIQLRHSLKRIPSRDTLAADTRAVWHYGKWLSSGELVGWIGQNGNTWLIGGLLGAPLVAGYRAASYVTNLFNPFDLAVSNYLPVRAARVLEEKGHPAMMAWLARQAILLSLPYVLLATVITLFALDLLDLFYDERYVTELLALVLVISVWARFVGFMGNFLRLGLMAAHRTLPVFISQIIGLIVFAAVSTILISWMGIAGAPLGKIVLQLIVGTYLFFKLREGASPSVPRVFRTGEAAS